MVTILDIQLQRRSQDSDQQCSDGQRPSPVYRQIADAIADHISSGALVPGDRLPTHRALAEQLSITIGTVTRGYREAERRGLVEARVGAGTYVRNNSAPEWVFEQPPGGGSKDGECDLGYNLPPPVDRSAMLKQAMEHLVQNPAELNALALYHPAEGIHEHRRVLAKWLKTYGVCLDDSQLLFTPGAQNAVQLVLMAFCKPGDTLLVERLTYPGLINLAKSLSITLKPVDMDDQGLIPDSLDNACRQYRPRFIYSTPTLQNPTTVTAGELRRQELLDVCRKHQLIFIEDEVNGLIPTNRPEPLVNHDPDTVIHVGSLSKCLAPGLRVGYLQVPQSLRKKVLQTLQNQCWMTSPLLTGLAAHIIRLGFADQAIQSIRSQLSERQALMERYLGDFSLLLQQGSYHGWLTLPDSWSLSDFISTCSDQKILVKSSELFVPPGGSIPPAVRISHSAPISLASLEQGLGSLRALLVSESEPVHNPL